MIIRNETAKDFKEIYYLIETAFKTAKVSDGKEQDFTCNLRISSSYIPELAFVAEDNGKIVGHIMLTELFFDTPNNREKAVMLAPLSVALEYRKHGIGAALAIHALAKAKELGYKSSFVVGDPAYYCRFGYCCIDNFGISNTNGIPSKYVLCQELQPAALAQANGAKVSFPEE